MIYGLLADGESALGDGDSALGDGDSALIVISRDLLIHPSLLRLGRQGSRTYPPSPIPLCYCLGTPRIVRRMTPFPPVFMGSVLA